MKIKHPDTDLLRSIAILLVLNSHLDAYYPVPYIGTGGAIGNSLFFFLSAYGLAKSAQKSQKLFSKWLTRRIERIYPAVWIVIIFLKLPSMAISGSIANQGFFTYAGYFFYPPFWFIKAILIYYILSYDLIFNYTNRKTLLFMLALGTLYVYFYLSAIDLSVWSIEKLPFKIIYYFIVFIFGIYVARRENSIGRFSSFDSVFLLYFFLSIYTHKFLMSYNLFTEWQFLQQLATIPLVYLSLKLCKHHQFQITFLRNRFLSTIFQFLSNHTLEIYIVHVIISHHVLQLSLFFPLNIFVFLATTFMLSFIIQKQSNKIISMFFYRNAIKYDVTRKRDQLF